MDPSVRARRLHYTSRSVHYKDDTGLLPLTSGTRNQQCLRLRQSVPSHPFLDYLDDGTSSTSRRVEAHSGFLTQTRLTCTTGTKSGLYEFGNPLPRLGRGCNMCVVVCARMGCQEMSRSSMCSDDKPRVCGRLAY